MASNRVFVSPGVYTSEKDLTFVTRQVGVTTLGMVGETVKGPAFQPIFVTNYDEYKAFFGGLSPEKYIETGYPKYEASYIAKSYLSQSNQLYMTRVLGLSGYDSGKAWGITLNANLDTTTTGVTTGSSSGLTLNYTTNPGGTITAITTSDSRVSYLFTTSDIHPEITTQLSNIKNLDTLSSYTGTIMWYKPDEFASAYQGVAISVTKISGNTSSVTGRTTGTSVWYSGTSYSDVEKRILAVLRSKASYDGNETLNFDVSATTFDTTNSTTALSDPYGQFVISGNSSIVGDFTYNVSFDTTKNNYITKVFGTTPNSKNTPLYVEEVYLEMLNNFYDEGKVKGINTSGATALSTYASKFRDFKSQYLAACTPYFVSEVRGKKVLRLFKLWTISDGDHANQEIKVSIANIRPDEKTFDLLIRSFGDTDARPSILEKFTNLTMDPTANNYIGRRIGTIDGEFSSNSNYVLVELATEADTSTAFPAGFIGFPIRDYFDVGSNVGVQAPTVFYKETYSVYENKRKYYLGISDTVGFDQNLFNYKGVPDTTSPDMWTGLTKGFHMDVTASAVTIDGVSITIDSSGTTYSPTFEFETGNLEFQSETQIAQDVAGGNTDYQKLYARKFTTVPFGGFDGWDIYRKRRTNTDTYSKSGVKGLAGVANDNFGAYILSNEEEGITSDYYAYLDGILTFNNPEQTNINVFATPGIDSFENTNLIEETIDMVENNRADSLYILTTPDVDAGGAVLTEDDVVNQLDGMYDSNYSATYWPWIQVNDAENNVYIWLPPTRDVVRNIAYTDNVAYPWFSIAGVDRGDVDCMKARKVLSQTNRDTLYEGRVNPIATFASEGVKIWGNKTLQVKDSALNRINVRRLLLQARKLISAVSLRLLFDQDDSIVRNQFLKLVNPILENIRSSRGLVDFRVVVDNSAESIDRNELNGTIYIKPTKALEFINIEFVVTPTGASFDNI